MGDPVNSLSESFEGGWRGRQPVAAGDRRRETATAAGVYFVKKLQNGRICGQAPCVFSTEVVLTKLTQLWVYFQTRRHK